MTTPTRLIEEARKLALPDFSGPMGGYATLQDKIDAIASVLLAIDRAAEQRGREIEREALSQTATKQAEKYYEALAYQDLTLRSRSEEPKQ